MSASIAEKLQAVRDAKGSLATAIAAKGGTVPALFADYGAAVAALPSGGGGRLEPKDVNFHDYDGTLVASYTLAEAAALAALPAEPTHVGLTGQGWNYTLAQVKAAQGLMDVGALYTPTDGKTKLYLEFDGPVCLTQPLDLMLLGTVRVDWGDGSAVEEVTGGDEELEFEEAKTLTHTYAPASYPATYVISVESVSGVWYLGGWDEWVDNPRPQNVFGPLDLDHALYRSRLRKVELGPGMPYLWGYVFYSCQRLESVTVPATLGSFGSAAFHYCTSLRYIVESPAMTTVPSAFYETYSIEGISVSPNATRVEDNAFSSAGSLRRLSFPAGMVTIGADAFSGSVSLRDVYLPPSCTEIRARAFKDCVALRAVRVNGGTSLGAYAFCSDDAVREVYLPDGMTAVGNQAFNGCEALTKVRFPASIASLGELAFSSCFSVGLWDFSASAAIPTVTQNTFPTGMGASMKIAVPDALYETWKTTGNWTKYASCIVRASEV